MTSRPLHSVADGDPAVAADPQTVVEDFLDALAESDLDAAAALLADGVVYTNVGLPTLRGRDRVVRALGLMDRPGASFEVFLHAISASGPTVLTERTDALIYRRYRAQFWVTGRFDVHAGRITLWRDSFDYVDVVLGSLRGVLGLAVPSLRPTLPTTADTPPGRH
ncbi:MAG TPA: limonene-1,2-epoxide hydrolase family protein [Jatrophihabitans sp.]|jgi:limonene-1,2-epoxide hydrolase|uniref:limonene-1,2-epoxide hydrolase family protein n=1 Tax=Jatrophihabitans sp. TaxID=1932789 RepID=UPI002DF843E8|nr:limonene-1,2-epoxide hydrolase family protein [Jatrophihabitans sp.]